MSLNQVGLCWEAQHRTTATSFCSFMVLERPILVGRIQRKEPEVWWWYEGCTNMIQLRHVCDYIIVKILGESGVQTSCTWTCWGLDMRFHQSFKGAHMVHNWTFNQFSQIKCGRENTPGCQVKKHCSLSPESTFKAQGPQMLAILGLDNNQSRNIFTLAVTSIATIYIYVWPILTDRGPLSMFVLPPAGGWLKSRTEVAHLQPLATWNPLGLVCVDSKSTMNVFCVYVNKFNIL